MGECVKKALDMYSDASVIIFERSIDSALFCKTSSLGQSTIEDAPIFSGFAENLLEDNFIGYEEMATLRHLRDTIMRTWRGLLKEPPPPKRPLAPALYSATIPSFFCFVRD